MPADKTTFHRHEPRRFLQETIDKPRAGLWGDLNTKHPIISYRYIPDAPDEPYYFTEFNPGNVVDRCISRLELCKIWATVVNASILLHWMRHNLTVPISSPYVKYHEHLDSWTEMLQGFEQEIGLAMEVLVDWEAAHHLPWDWDRATTNNRTSHLSSNPRRLVPGDIGTAAAVTTTVTTTDTGISVKTSSGPAPRKFRRGLSPLFLFAASDASRFIRVLRYNPLTEMMGDAIPDCEYYNFPPGFPIRDSETRLLDEDEEQVGEGGRRSDTAATPRVDVEPPTTSELKALMRSLFNLDGQVTL